MLTSVCEKIIDSMARTLHVTAYADAVENGTLKGKRAGAGQNWEEIAPKTRPIAIKTAYYLAGKITEMNKASLLFLVRQAMKADAMEFKAKNEKTPKLHWEMVYDGLIANLNGTTEYQDGYLESFGHCLAMESLGHGASWFDDHAEFKFKLPLIEFNY